MSRPSRLAAIVLSVLLIAPPLSAEAGISLAEARERAVASSRVLKKALLSVDGARLTQKAQLYDVLPQLAAGAQASRTYPDASEVVAGASLSVSQAVYDGGKHRAQSSVNALATRIAQEQAREAHLAVLQGVEEAYYGVMEAAATVDAARGDLEASRVHDELSQARLEVGTITRQARLQVLSEMASKETALSDARRSLSVATAKLASLVGLPGPLTLAGVDFGRYEDLAKRLAALADESTAALFSRLFGEASRRNPTLAVAALESSKARSEVALARRDYLPTISASWAHSVDTTGTDDRTGTGSVGVTASIPLNAWITTAAVDARRTSAGEADLSLEEERRTLELEIQEAVYDTVASARSIASSRRALEYAESAYQSVLESYRLSAASSSNLSDAEALVSTNRSSLISTRHRFLTNLSTLRTLAGLDGEDALLEIIP
jgi:outer membrane protein